MSSRDTILQRIRQSLAGSAPVARPEPLVLWPEAVAEAGQKRADLAAQFITELDAVQGETVHCDSIEAAQQRLLELMDASQWATLATVDRPLCRELTAKLPAERLAVLDAKTDPKELAVLPAGLITVEYLLADTGTCVVSNHTTEERLICFLPPTCVVVATVDQLVADLPTAWKTIAKQTAEPERRGEFVLITGPSRTADIEKILILGAHGPKRLIVLLID